MQRPTVRCLMSVLWLLTSPNDKCAALAVARSVIFGMDDESIISHLSKHTGNQIEGLANAVSSK